MSEFGKQIDNLLKLIEQESTDVKTISQPSKLRLGYMYLHVYDPKLKDQLPFYDVLPVFVLLARKSDRILGLNLHYLPYSFRVAAAKYLMQSIKNKKRIDYQDIKAAFKASKAPIGMLQLCIRTYLYSHIRSNIKEFNPTNYEMVIKEVMPRFEKKTEENIYRIIMSKFYKRAGGVSKTKWRKGVNK